MVAVYGDVFVVTPDVCVAGEVTSGCMDVLLTPDVCVAGVRSNRCVLVFLCCMCIVIN